VKKRALDLEGGNVALVGTTTLLDQPADYDKLLQALSQSATTAPGFFLIGRLDEPHRTANITPVFEAGRGAGAPWSLSTDAFGHGPIVDLDLMFDWIDAVLTARLPATAGAPLRAMAETAGWLGNRSTGAVSTYACYGAARSSASWLPSQEAALGWQRMAGGSVVSSNC